MLIITLIILKDPHPSIFGVNKLFVTGLKSTAVSCTYFLLGDLYLSHVAHHVFHSKQTFCAGCVSAHSACLNKRRTQLHLLTNLVSLYTRSAAYCLISPDTSRTECLLALAAVDLTVSQCSAEEVQGRKMPFHLSKKLQFLFCWLKFI